ncbi:MAG: hypothetical protein ARM1_0319 [Candidatus Micrarchaeota archaeon]|nr:MAG: hypothetical protein ARM1_0319 [Candidatus Micrarchaeota archaeon]
MRFAIVSYLNGSIEGLISWDHVEKNPDISFYYKKINDEITLIAIDYNANKLDNLTQALFFSNSVIIDSSITSADVAELIIAAYNAGKKLYLVNLNEQLADMLNSSDIYRYKNIELNADAILNEAANMLPNYCPLNPYLFVDRAFAVKGVGTVALAINKGHLKKNDILYLGSKKTTVRSIQIADLDYTEVNNNARVGVALKDIDAKELEKGDILTSNEYSITDTINIDINSISIFNIDELINNPKRFKITCGFKSLYIKEIKKVSDNNFDLKLTSSIANLPNVEILVFRDYAKPRIVAHGFIR